MKDLIRKKMKVYKIKMVKRKEGGGHLGARKNRM